MTVIRQWNAGTSEWEVVLVGTQGAVGPQGTQGATGPQGAVGTNGTNGAQGDTGAQGPQGTQGSIGSQGVQGAQGAQGESFVAQSLKPSIYYGPAMGDPQQSTFVPVANRTYYTPFVVDETKTFDRIAMRTQSPFYSGTGSFRLGIYNDSDNAPSTVNLDAGTVSTTAGNTLYEITISHTLTAGYYWLAFNCISVSSGTVYVLGQFGSRFLLPNSHRFNTTTGLQDNTFIQSGASGAFATATSLTQAGISDYCPNVFLRKS